MLKQASFWCVVPAAGRGSRVGGEVPKQYMPLAGRPLIEHTLERLAAHPLISGLLITLGAGDAHWRDMVVPGGKPVRTAQGGAERSDSVLAGLDALPGDVTDDDFVLVHDAARPCVRARDITRLIELAGAAGGGLLGAPLRDTLKRVDDENFSRSTESRDCRWRAFTPQMFRRGPLSLALRDAQRRHEKIGDEAMAMELAGFAPLLVEGAEDNIKVTTPADFALAEFLLGENGVMRIGNGFDVHAFGDGDHLMLGGVHIAHRQGVVAHSDGDVVIHALCDAIFGALALGDIGTHFPPGDPRWRDADSRQFLRHAASLMQQQGYRLGNADVTVICESPKVGPHAHAMREALASDLRVDIGRISVKATTTEKLGFTGRGEGIAAQACVLLECDETRPRD